MTLKFSNGSDNSMSERCTNAAEDSDVAPLSREHLCGYDLNLTYPQDGNFPDLQLIYPNSTARSELVYAKKSSPMYSKRELLREGMRRYGRASLRTRDRPNHLRRELAKRDLAGRANGTIDPWYGCFIYDEMIDYALNFSLPWSESFPRCFGLSAHFSAIRGT